MVRKGDLGKEMFLGLPLDSLTVKGKWTEGAADTICYCIAHSGA
jgi:hypothetical protein